MGDNEEKNSENVLRIQKMCMHFFGTLQYLGQSTEHTFQKLVRSMENRVVMLKEVNEKSIKY